MSFRASSAPTVERDVVVGMIVSDRFLRRLRPHWDPAWHRVDICRTVAGWCVEHWDRYGRAPGAEIEKRWADWAEGPNTDPTTTELVARMLELASAEYERVEQFNDDYLLDRTEQWARGRSLKALADDLDQADRTGDVDWGAQRFGELKLPRLGGRRSWADPADKESMRRAFERTYQPLFRIPGPLGELLNPQMYREGFVAWMAPEKRGKTQLLLEMTYWALRTGRCRVVFFAIGDMSEDELRLRWASRLTGEPDTTMSWKRALRAVRRFERKRSVRGYLRFQAWPNFVASCTDLERELDEWEAAEGWIADMVVVDYADNLVPTNRDDYRHRVNAVWQGLRKISQERRCLLLTVTQTDADSYERDNIRLGNFSEDKRKYGHVTAIGAINQDGDERELDQVRLGWLMLRRGLPRGQVFLQGDRENGRLIRDLKAVEWVSTSGRKAGEEKG